MEAMLSSEASNNLNVTVMTLVTEESLIMTLQHCDNLTQVERVTFAALIGVMAVVAVIGNTLVCFTLLRLKMPARLFLINLAISDIIVGSFVMPCCVVTLLLRRWVFGSVMCDIVAFLKTMSLFSGALTLCAIAVDRYYNIKHVRYVMKFPWKVVGLLIPWLGSGLTAVVPLLGWAEYKWSPNKPVCTVDWLHSPSYALFCFISFGFVPQIFISCCYLSIAMYVHQKKNHVRRSRAFALRSHTASVSPNINADNTSADSNTFHHPGPVPNAGRVHFSREEIGVLKTMVVIVFVFSTVAIPYITMQLISLRRNHEFSLRAETINTTFLYVGACLNPFIYSGGSKKFRQALKKTVMRAFKCPNV